MLWNLCCGRDEAEETREPTTRDPLTGLLNRRGLERLRLEWHDAPIGVVLLDVESFRSFNLEEGFTAGDRALADIAARLQRSALSGTVVARFGSDEFVAAVTGSPVHEVTA